MKKTLLLIDGYSLIYRSYWAFIKSPIFSPDGENISAVFGFLKTLFSLIEKKNPGGVAVVMDSKVPTFRHEIYPQYKGTRDKAPDDLHAQVPVLTEILQSIKIPVINRDRYEADDIMAALARNIAGRDVTVYIVSSDKDLMQVIDNSIHMLKYEKGNYFDIDPEGVRERLGIYPEQIIDYLALIGDASDNIPGVRGIGPKTAVNLLGRYGSLEEIYNNISDCPKSAGTKLQQKKDDAFLSKRLVTLEYDIPLNYGYEDFLIERGRFAAAIPVMQKLGMKSLVSSAVKMSGISADSIAAADTSSFGGRGMYKAVTTEEGLVSLVKKVKERGVFALDIETDSIDALRAEPAGFSVSVASKEGWYIPLTAGGKRYFTVEKLRPYIQELTGDWTLKLVGHNFKYDYKVLKRWGVRVDNLYFDTIVAAWLLDTSAPSYSMDSIAERNFNYKTIKYHDVVPKDKKFADVGLEEAVEYAAEDADITFRFYENFAKQLKKRSMEKLFFDLEMPLVTILGDMEYRGIGIQAEKLNAYSLELEEELFSIERKIYDECGKEFNINSTKQLQEILFQDRQLKPVKKTKTGFSTDIKVLEILSKEDIVPALVLQHRSLAKLKSTYVDSLPLLVNPETGRLHTNLVQTGTATGRLSSRDPNLQNIPIRSSEGRRIREAFTASEGSVFVSADYSQIELVVLAHLSGDRGLTEAFLSGTDVHSFTGSLIFGVEPDEVTKDQRRIAKTINFGVMYGMSAYRLARELSLPVKDASRFIDAYFERYVGIRDFMDKTVKAAEEKGFVRTLMGRERRINGINSHNKTEKAGAERIAVNTVIQGSAADIVKTAMIRIHKKLKAEKTAAAMILQVHDELIFEVPEADLNTTFDLVKTEMENAVILDIPLRVSVESGKSWGDFH